MVRVSAPAKINFTLDITGKLENGYHTVDMVMQSVDLCDVVTVEKNNFKKINLSCNKPYVPCNSSNTAYNAVQLFAQHCGLDCGVNIHIEKQIPAQAGLAGGSTDGMAVLVALNYLYGTDLSDNALAELGAKIGADVPFCLYGGTMLATGIGTKLERVEPQLDLQQYHILLCKPQINVSTPLAYKKADSRPFSSKVHSGSVISALLEKYEKGFLNGLYNDFDSLLNIGEVQHIKAVMKENGALAAVMSGSGPTVYGVYSSLAKAENTAEMLKREFEDVYIAKCCSCGCTVLE